MQAALKRPSESDGDSYNDRVDLGTSVDSNAAPDLNSSAGIDLSGAGDLGAPRHKRRKQAAPTRAAPITPPPNDFHTKMVDIYKNAMAFSAELAMPTFDPLSAYRLLPRPLDQPRIFNPEAYCDLCCKEFCNKYFLKTHRANKHGIYDSPEEVRQVKRPNTPPERRVSEDDFGLGTPRRLSPDSARKAREGGFHPETLRMLGVVDPEAFCEICCKEYCNKYFLKTHKERKHFASINSSPQRSPTQMLTLPEFTNLPPNVPSLPPPLLALPPPPPMKLEENYEEEEENSNMARDQTSPLNLKLEERGVSPSSANEELRKLQTMISQLNELTAERLVKGENGHPRDSRPPSSSPPNSDDNKRSSSGSSFCEICNKELCNKYFMRTHMQRMHGISLDGGTQLGGVTCDICHKELCSKYFLRVHKHNTHGIPAPPTPTVPPAAEPCPLCSRRFRGPRALRAHLLAEHAPSAAAGALAESSTPTPADTPLELLSADKQYACSYCPFTTSVLAFLFAHERAHAQEEGSMSPQSDGYSCSRCEYRTSEFSAMEMHLRTAHGGALLAIPAGSGGATMQPFVLEEQGGGGFVPSLVFLPVRRRATRRATVTFTLTPA